MSRSTGPARMPPRSDETSDMAAASASAPTPATPHNGQARVDRRPRSPRPAAVCGGGGAPQWGLACRRGSGGARQLARAGGDELGVRRGRTDRSAAAAEARGGGGGEGFGSAGRWEGQGRGERSRRGGVRREEEEREKRLWREGNEAFYLFLCLYNYFFLLLLEYSVSPRRT